MHEPAALSHGAQRRQRHFRLVPKSGVQAGPDGQLRTTGSAGRVARPGVDAVN